MNNTYAQAVRYVGMGWSVIPLAPGTKDQPLVKWKEFQQRIPSKDELMKWFGNPYIKNNIGIVTGAISNLSVIDADELKNLPMVSSSITVITRRGKHLYFKYSEEKNSVSKIAEAIDTRGSGGYVCAPPSVINNFRYRFVQHYINPTLLRPFPRELMDAIPKFNTASGEVKKGRLDLAELFAALGEGNRNDSFARAVGSLHRDGYSADSIDALLRPHAVGVGFDLGELLNVIQSVTRYENRQTTGYEIHTQGNQAEDITDFLKGEEKVEWIVPGVVAKSSIGFVAGLPETYKTWIMADLAIEAGVGGTWLGIKVNKARTLFIDQERFKGETRRRFKKMIKAKNLSMKDLHNNLYIQVGSSVRLNLEESFEAFRRKLAEIRPDLVIVDSFATFSTVAENDRQEVQKVLEKIKQLRQEFGCTFMLIDHEGKSVLNPETVGDVPDAFKMVGSVGKPAAAETVLVVRKDKANSVTVFHAKSTLAPAVAPINVQVVDTENDGIKLVVQ